MADIQQPWNPADVAEFEHIKAVFTAGQRQDHAVIRHGLGQFGIVIAPRFGPIAAADQEETANLARLDRLDHLICHAHYGISPKTDHNPFFLGVGGKARSCQSRLDNRRKIFILSNVPHIRPGDQACGKDSVFITFFRALDAVGCHQNRARENIKFFVLVLPGSAEVANQVLEFFQSRIGQAR
ncbi:MAG: hypothetical protein BWY69_00266 [Planctomycetes bacterium ADurb.Bin401]|nr:MAG: hypothetical protein BWY69_00266 [Planctomycetes bacterium ADurb.Bin401]